MIRTLTIFSLILLAHAGYAQKSPPQRQGVKLITLSLGAHRKPHTGLSDTTAAIITAAYKVGVNKAPVTFEGYIVRTGRRTRFYCKDWQPMPVYLKAINTR